MTGWIYVFLSLLFVGLLLFKRTETLHERIFPGLYNSPDFPEERFPAKDTAAFEEKVAAGYQNMKVFSVVFCAIAKNVAEFLPLTLERIERTARCFKGYRVIVYENDSTDGTLEILSRWETGNKKVKILAESLAGKPAMRFERTERLAYCRNQYMNALKQSQEYDTFEYVIVLDMDLRGGWSYDGIASSFSRLDWDIVISNSIGYHFLRKTYYDTFALGPRDTLKTTWLWRIIGEGWQLKRNGQMIPVHSGFGGLGIYRKDAMLSNEYSAFRNGQVMCEHDAMNPGNSLRCFLNPSQITVTGTQEPETYLAEAPWKRTLRRLFLNW